MPLGDFLYDVLYFEIGDVIKLARNAKVLAKRYF
nr:MAG TPA: hypothetical protein [Caudoviricetes sp.]